MGRCVVIRASVAVGSLMVEFLIALVVTTIIVTGFLHVVSTTQLTSNRLIHAFNNASALQAAHDIIERDIRSCSAAPKEFCVVDNEYIMRCIYGMQADWVDVGWSLQDNALYRRHGLFNYRACSWSSSKKTLIVRDIEEFSLTPHIKNGLICTINSVVSNKHGDSRKATIWLPAFAYEVPHV